MAAVLDEVAPVAGTSVLSFKEKLERGTALKEEGNEFFKQKQYRNAMKKYHRALLHVLGLADQPPFLQQYQANLEVVNEEQKEEVHQIQFSCYNNLAGSLNKFFSFDIYP